MRLSKTIFYTVLLLLPLNLGKHFIIKDAYVTGLLVNYLVPTLYVQDILLILLFVTYFCEQGLPGKDAVLNLLNKKYVRLVVYFLFSVFLSVLISNRPVPAAYALVRLTLYAAFFIYTIENSSKLAFGKILKIFAISTTALSFLAFAQFARQGALFNNYLFFGEQPYTASTPGIVRESILGHTVVPAYGLFAHPNVFGGFLSISLVWLLSRVSNDRRYLLPLFLGIIALVMTISVFSLVSFVLGCLLFAAKTKCAACYKLAVTIAVTAVLGFVALRATAFVQNNPSLYRRAELLEASLTLFRQSPLYGVGLNTLSSRIEETLKLKQDIRFVQPVHNIFVLVLTESGIMSLIFFVLLLAFCFKRACERDTNLFAISLVQLVFLGSFDHYLLTIPQTQLLFWFTLGLAVERV